MPPNGPFPASSKVQGQSESRRAYQQLLADLRAYPWWQDYEEIVAMGWSNWRHAVLIAWSASPAHKRRPATQQELATEVLGLKSDRVIASWRKKHPEIEQTIAAVQAGPLMRYRRDVFDALAKSARDPDHRHAADRRIFLSMTGDLVDHSKIDQTTELKVEEHTADMIAKIYGEPEGEDDA